MCCIYVYKFIFVYQAGIIEEMLDDTLEDALGDEDLDEDVQEEVDKVLSELTAGESIYITAVPAVEGES